MQKFLALLTLFTLSTYSCSPTSSNKSFFAQLKDDVYKLLNIKDEKKSKKKTVKRVTVLPNPRQKESAFNQMDSSANKNEVSGKVLSIIENINNKQMRVTVVTENQVKKFLELDIDPDNYNHPPLEEGKKAKFIFSGDEELILKGFKYNSYKNLNFQIESQEDQQGFKSYKINSILDLRDKLWINLTNEAGMNVKTYFYAKAMQKLLIAGIQKGDELKLAKADLSKKFVNIYFNEDKISGIKKNSAASNTTFSGLSKTATIVNRDQLQSLTIEGVISDLGFFQSRDYQALNFNINYQGQMIKMFLKYDLDDSTITNYPLIKNGSKLSISFEDKQRSIQRSLTRGKFHLKKGTFKANFSNTEKVATSVSGIYNNHFVKDKYAMINLKAQDKRYSVYVYDKAALSVLSQIVAKRGCQISVGDFNIIENKRYIITKDFKINALECN